MVASINRGTPIWSPKYFNSHFRDPNTVPLILGHPHIDTSGVCAQVNSGFERCPADFDTCARAACTKPPDPDLVPQGS